MDVDFRLYTKVSGVYKRKTILQITSCDFELMEKGGMGAGSFSLPVKWEDLSFTGDEFLDVYLFDSLVYRGFVQLPSREVSSPETVTCAMQSVVALLNKYPVRWKLAYGGGADIGVIAQDVITDFAGGVNTNRLASYLTGDYQTTGITLKEFDARGKSVQQALNQLVETAPTVIWGVEARWDSGPPGNPQHRIYVRPKPTTTSKYYSIGGNISGFTYPQDIGAVINVVNFQGGLVQQPNLAYNGSFEEIAPASETVANLLLDYSFEENDAAWTLTGTRKFTGMDATARGVPKTGKYWLELDTNTESGIQVVLAPYTVQYTGIAWIRREDTAATQVKLTLEGLDVTNVVIVTATTGYVTPASRNWEKISVDLDPTASSTVVKIRYRVETNGGTASNDGVLVDDCALIEKGGEGAIGWRRIVAGVANASSFTWNYKPSTLAYHGGYVVDSDPSAIAGASDYVEIRTTKDKRIEVQPNERYSFLAWFYRAASVDVDISIGVIEYDSSGTVLATNEGATTTILASWVGLELEISGSSDRPGFTTQANTRSVELFIRHRDNDRVYIDGVFFCQGDIPSDVRANGDYWAGENYERRLKVTDSIFSGSYALNSDAAASITSYGEREEEISEPLVTDLDGVKRWGRDYFNVSAVPNIQANLSINGLQSGERANCADGKVKIQNLPSAPSALFPARVHFDIQNGQINMTADLGSEVFSMEQLLRYVQDREKGRAF